MNYYLPVRVVLTAATALLIAGGCQKTPSTAVELVEAGGVKMISIPAGSFVMGHDYRYRSDLADNVNVYFSDEQPAHPVSLTAFQIGQTEITQGLYREITGENPSTFSGDDNLPVTNIGATAALAFCNILSEKAGLETCYDEKTGACDFSKNGFRLPTEAEWEYACRAGTSTLFLSGDTEADLARVGWYSGNSGGKTHPVAQKEPNAWGLYDMHGNVYEFCYDGYDNALNHSSYPAEAVQDPINFESFNYRMMRGGGWFSDPASCRSFTRGKFWTGGGNYYIGFRVARRS